MPSCFALALTTGRFRILSAQIGALEPKPSFLELVPILSTLLMLSGHSGMHNAKSRRSRNLAAKSRTADCLMMSRPATFENKQQNDLCLVSYLVTV